jgi:DNA polymerase V
MPLVCITNPSEIPSGLELPLFSGRVSAGFPSPADDFIDRSLDLNEYLVKRPASTYFAWAQGDSLRDIGILDGDLLIIDRAVERTQGVIVVAAIDGELTCKILDVRHKRLLSANPDYPAINIAGREDLVIEGVVVFSIRKHIR